MHILTGVRIAVMTGSIGLIGCGGNSEVAPVPEETRLQDSRVFTADAAATTFAAMTAATGDAVDIVRPAVGRVF